jgi:hypothetical protein
MKYNTNIIIEDQFENSSRKNNELDSDKREEFDEIKDTY